MAGLHGDYFNFCFDATAPANSDHAGGDLSTAYLALCVGLTNTTHVADTELAVGSNAGYSRKAITWNTPTTSVTNNGAITFTATGDWAATVDSFAICETADAGNAKPDDAWFYGSVNPTFSLNNTEQAIFGDAGLTITSASAYHNELFKMAFGTDDDSDHDRWVCYKAADSKGYLALCDGLSQTALMSASELDVAVDTGYARSGVTWGAVTIGSSGSSVASSSAASFTNAAGAAWTTVDTFAICEDDVELEDDAWFWGTFTSAFALADGATAQFATGAITISCS